MVCEKRLAKVCDSNQRVIWIWTQPDLRVRDHVEGITVCNLSYSCMPRIELEQLPASDIECRETASTENLPIAWEAKDSLVKVRHPDYSAGRDLDGLNPMTELKSCDLVTSSVNYNRVVDPEFGGSRGDEPMVAWKPLDDAVSLNSYLGVQLRPRVVLSPDDPRLAGRGRNEHANAAIAHEHRRTDFRHRCERGQRNRGGWRLAEGLLGQYGSPG